MKTPAFDPAPSDWLRRRAARTWLWPLTALFLFALELAFGLWVGLNFQYISGCRDVVREMEVGALPVSPGQTLSLSMPLWLALGALAYSLALVQLLRFWWLERRYLRLLKRPPRSPPEPWRPSWHG
jgi:disulfide bond formation protein DsbB